MNCTFCEIAVNQQSREIIYESDNSLAFLDEKPVTDRGHILVIPKKHFDDIAVIDQLSLARLMQDAQLTAQLLLRDASITGFNLLVNTGESAGQRVFHAHIHLIARTDGDHAFPLPQKPSFPDLNLRSIAERIKRNIPPQP